MWRKVHVDTVSSIPEEQKGLGKASEDTQTRPALGLKGEPQGGKEPEGISSLS